MWAIFAVAVFGLFFWRAFPKLSFFQQIVCLALVGIVVFTVIIPTFSGGS